MVTVYIEHEIGVFGDGGRSYRVATSAAPNTIRVYDIGASALVSDPPMVCTIAGIWRSPDPSWGAAYVGLSDDIKAGIVAGAIDITRRRIAQVPQ